MSAHFQKTSKKQSKTEFLQVLAHFLGPVFGPLFGQFFEHFFQNLKIVWRFAPLARGLLSSYQTCLKALKPVKHSGKLNYRIESDRSFAFNSQNWSKSGFELSWIQDSIFVTPPRTRFSLSRPQIFEFAHATRRGCLLDLCESVKTGETFREAKLWNLKSPKFHFHISKLTKIWI